MLRVLHVIPAVPYGGAQILIEHLTSALRGLGIDARVLALYDHPVFSQNLRRLKVPFATTRNGRFFDPLVISRLIEAIRENRPHLIHIHLPLLWSTLALVLLKRCSFIVHEHIIPTYPRRPSFKRSLIKCLVCNYADAIVGISRYVTESAKTYYSPSKAKFITIYNGISIPSRPHRSLHWPSFMGEVNPGRPLVGMLCRFSKSKGIEEFIESIPQIRAKLPEARFVLGGDGPLRQFALDARCNLGLNGILSLPGFIKDNWQFWANIDFAVFTSPSEPFGLRIVEPQAMGVPVVGYKNYTGSDEIIENGVTGLLVPWRDSRLLAQEMARLWQEKSPRDAMVEAAYKRVVEKFCVDRMALECSRLYQQLLR